MANKEKPLDGVGDGKERGGKLSEGFRNVVARSSFIKGAVLALGVLGGANSAQAAPSDYEPPQAFNLPSSDGKTYSIGDVLDSGTDNIDMLVSIADVNNKANVYRMICSNGDISNCSTSIVNGGINSVNTTLNAHVCGNKIFAIDGSFVEKCDWDKNNFVASNCVKNIRPADSFQCIDEHKLILNFDGDIGLFDFDSNTYSKFSSCSNLGSLYDLFYNEGEDKLFLTTLESAVSHLDKTHIQIANMTCDGNYNCTCNPPIYDNGNYNLVDGNTYCNGVNSDTLRSGGFRIDKDGNVYFSQAKTTNGVLKLYRSLKKVATASCGDGVVNQSSEECDEGVNNTDNSCNPGYGESCSTCDTSCKSHTFEGAKCGDGNCDSGNEDSVSCPSDCGGLDGGVDSGDADAGASDGDVDGGVLDAEPDVDGGVTDAEPDVDGGEVDAGGDVNEDVVDGGEVDVKPDVVESDGGEVDSGVEGLKACGFELAALSPGCEFSCHGGNGVKELEVKASPGGVCSISPVDHPALLSFTNNTNSDQVGDIGKSNKDTSYKALYVLRVPYKGAGVWNVDYNFDKEVMYRIGYNIDSTLELTLGFDDSDINNDTPLPGSLYGEESVENLDVNGAGLNAQGVGGNVEKCSASLEVVQKDADTLLNVTLKKGSKDAVVSIGKYGMIIHSDFTADKVVTFSVKALLEFLNGDDELPGIDNNVSDDAGKGDEGCGCSVVGGESESGNKGGLGVGALLALGGALLRRKRK